MFFNSGRPFFDSFIRFSDNSFPKPWQVSFQKPATTMMEGIIDLHHDIFTFLVVIIVFVSFMLGTIFWRYLERIWDLRLIRLPRSQFESGHGITHNTVLETVWTIVPTLVLLFIATPSFALIYALDEVVEPQVTVRIVGRQWYWTYEYPDTVKVRVPFGSPSVSGQLPDLDSTIQVRRSDVSDIIENLVAAEVTRQEGDIWFLRDIIDQVKIEMGFETAQVDSWWKDLLDFLSKDSLLFALGDPLEARSNVLLVEGSLSVGQLSDLVDESREPFGFLYIFFNSLLKDDVFLPSQLRDLIQLESAIVEQQFVCHTVLDALLKGYLWDYITFSLIEDVLDALPDDRLAEVLAFGDVDQSSNSFDLITFVSQQGNFDGWQLVASMKEDQVFDLDSQNYRDEEFLSRFLVFSNSYYPFFALDVLLHVPGFSLNSYIVPTEDLLPGAFRLLEVNRRMVLPFATNIRLLMTSYDVLHSWAVPAFGVKVDCVPGRLNEYFVHVNYRGIFYGQCSEICGVNHGFMPIKVEVMTDEHFRWWFASTSLGENSAIRFRSLWQLSSTFLQYIELVVRSGIRLPTAYIMSAFSRT